MSYQQCHQLLKELRLSGMSQELEHQRSNIDFSKVSFNEGLCMLLTAQKNYRSQKAHERRFKKSQLHKQISDLVFDGSRGLERDLFNNLLTCDWIEQGLHVFLTGATGTGKSRVANELGIEAVRQGYNTYYVRFPTLVEDIEIAFRDGSLPELRNKILKMRLLIIDDWGLSPITERSRQELLEIIVKCTDEGNNGSLIISSQLPVDQWHLYLGEEAVAEAILDRIVHSAHHIQLRGESMRKINAQKLFEQK